MCKEDKDCIFGDRTHPAWPGVAKAKGRWGIMDMRSLLLTTRPQRQGLLQEGAMAMAVTHEQAINHSWARAQRVPPQMQQYLHQGKRKF
jgi:hypothetical protein